MGEILCNRECRRQMGAMLGAGTALAVISWWRDPVAGIACTAAVLAMLLLCGRYTRRRYRQIAALSEQLSRIAGGDYAMNIADYAEGELSILSSEMLKITGALSHQANRLQRDKAFLADTLADISHQLRTPLTSLSVLADLLESPDLPEERRQEFLGGIRTSLDRIQWLVASLLKLSRLDAGAVVFQKKRTSLSEVVQAAVGPLRVAFDACGQQLVIEMGGDIFLETDRHWLAEAVGNLLKNCGEHAGSGGRIAVCCSQNPLYTQIQVTDNGPGIAQRDLPHIFERFYRGENASADSVGIGLALSRSIVRNLGGTLTAENRAQGGAAFMLKLYRDTDDPAGKP